LTPLIFLQVSQLTALRENDRVAHIKMKISGLCNGCLRVMKLQNQPEKKGP